jgi:hypothetical protein
MILILLFIVLFFVLLEIETLHWNLIESQCDIRRLSNRIYELQGAIRVLTLQKKEEKPRVKTMWISTTEIAQSVKYTLKRNLRVRKSRKSKKSKRMKLRLRKISSAFHFLH